MSKHYSEYREEELQTWATPRLVRFMKSVRLQEPKYRGVDYGAEARESYSKREWIRWNGVMGILRKILSTREHVVRKNANRKDKSSKRMGNSSSR